MGIGNTPYRVKTSGKNYSQEIQRKQEIHERRRKALALRTAGASYQDIVNADIGYNSPGAVGEDIRKILRSFQYETPEDVLVLDLARLDEMQKIATSHMRTTDWSTAMSMLLRIMQFRRDTLGITPEVISNRRNDANALVNNGIMVVQGTASDFLDGMMQAAGASEKERKKELERVASDTSSSAKGLLAPESIQLTKSQEFLEGEVLNDAERFVESFSAFSEDREQEDTRREAIPMMDLSQPVLSTDLPQDEVTTAKRIRKLRIPVKLDDSNVNPTSGISYKVAPRKLDDERAQKSVRRRLVRSQKSVDVELMVDEVESQTTAEKF